MGITRLQRIAEGDRVVAAIGAPDETLAWALA
jgi:hypothetical protein